MTGLRITLPTTFTDTTLPVLRRDSMLPDSGALLLVEPGHPTATTGALTSGMSLTNLAGEQAGALLATTAAATDPTLTLTGISATPNATGRVERSGKGGIHILMSAAAATTNGAVIRPTVAMADYLAANPSHDVFASLWMRITRTTTHAGGWSSVSFSTTAGGTELLYSFSGDANGTYPTNANRIGLRREPTAIAAAVGPVIRNVAVSQYTGTITKTGTAARDYFKIFGIGLFQPFSLGSPQPSAIFYRYYLEDLTVSGRTYAAVDALDYALYTQHVLTSGGRYYGDSYTDPATIP